MLPNCAIQIRAVWIVSAVLWANTLFAHVYPVLLAVHQIADLSAWLALSVHRIAPV